MPLHDNELIYKALLVGESGVGKTSLIRSLTGCQFTHNMLTTVGIDFVKVPFDVDGAPVTLQIWDTAGQERFRSITKLQYRGTKGLLLVYDISNRSTFETLSYWMASIERELELDVGEPVAVVVVGNKSDLQAERQVEKSEGRLLAEKYFLAGFFETSACDGTNVNECFHKLASSIVEVYNPEKMNMYRISEEITTLKRSTVFTQAQNGHSPNKDSNESKNKKLKNRKKKKKKEKNSPTIKLHSMSSELRRCGCG